jgi:hypothetical protein
MREDFGYDEPLTTTKYDGFNETEKTGYVEGASQTKSV